jgi:hypothetical protein
MENHPTFCSCELRVKKDVLSNSQLRKTRPPKVSNIYNSFGRRKP